MPALTVKLAPHLDPMDPAAAPLLERFYASAPERAEFREYLAPVPVYWFEPVDTHDPARPLEAFRLLADWFEEVGGLSEHGRPRDPKIDGRRDPIHGVTNPWDHAPPWLVKLSTAKRAALFEALREPHRYAPDTEEEVEAFLLSFGAPVIAECGRPGCSELAATRNYGGGKARSVGTNAGDWNTPDPFRFYGFCSASCRGTVGAMRSEFWRALAAWLPTGSKVAAAEAAELRLQAVEANRRALIAEATAAELRSLIPDPEEVPAHD